MQTQDHDRARAAISDSLGHALDAAERTALARGRRGQVRYLVGACERCDDLDVTAGEIAAAIDRESAALDATWAQWAERGAL